MALLFLSGFDIFGPANSNSTAVAALLTAGEWTNNTNSTANIVAPLSAMGNALLIGGVGFLSKTLAGNYGRLIGGVRFSNSLALTSGIEFLDSASPQVSITFNPGAGTFAVRNGSYNGGTILGTSTASVSANTPHYLEFDITFGNVGTGSYQLWLDGISILSGSGTVDTTTTANNYANVFRFQIGGSTTLTIDDLYLFDNTGTTNNAVLLTSPRIETQFPTGDGAVQFAVGAGIIGTSAWRATGNVSSTANQIRAQLIVPSVNCTINSIAFLAGSGASGVINLRPVVYSDTAGVPGTLLGSGSTATGVTASTAKTMPLTSGVSLTAGTRYWLGLMYDASVTNLFAHQGTTNDFLGSATFASGAPPTAPSMTTPSSTTVLWGNVSGTGANWYEVAQNPAQGSLSYVYEATVGEEDLYTYPALTAPPSAIYAVAVKASVAKSDAGAKTVSVRLKSGATDSAGTGGTQAPGTSYGWLTSHYPTDPNGSVPWTLSALNAAQAGVKVES